MADFKGKVTSATLEDGGTLEGSARVRGLIDVARTKFDIDITKLDASTDEILRLLGNITHISLSESTATYASNTKHITASGAFHGTIHNFKAKAEASMASGGEVALECSMQNPKNKRKGLQANIKANNANIAAILGKELFGTTTFSATVDAKFGNKEPLQLKGEGKVYVIGGRTGRCDDKLAKVNNGEIYFYSYNNSSKSSVHVGEGAKKAYFSGNLFTSSALTTAKKMPQTCGPDVEN